MEFSAPNKTIQYIPTYGVNQIYTRSNYCTTDHCKASGQSEEESADWWETTEKEGGTVHLILALFLDKQD